MEQPPGWVARARRDVVQNRERQYPRHFPVQANRGGIMRATFLIWLQHLCCPVAGARSLWGRNRSRVSIGPSHHEPGGPANPADLAFAEAKRAPARGLPADVIEPT